MTPSRARELVSGFEGRRIIVLGDIMLDEFVWGRVRRISPEAPVPIVEVERQTLMPGGAGNVASNLVALGAQPMLIGVTGRDPDAERLRALLKSLEMETGGIFGDPSRPTTLKTRIIAHNQQVVRADRESRSPIGPAIESQLLECFLGALGSAEAVIVSDYNKGLLTEGLLASVLGSARERGVAVCLDPKSKDFSRYQPVTIITPNHSEALEAAGISTDTRDGIEEAGRRILSSIDCRAVLITRGEEGMSLFTEDGQVNHIPAAAREVYDVTGAGDTVIAALTLAIASGASMVEAAVLANHAAGVVVGKVGTATVSCEELLSTFR